VISSQRAASKRRCGDVLCVLCSLARLSAPAHHRAPGIRRRGSDTGPFKLVVLRPTDSIKAHPQSRYSKPGRAYPTASSTQFRQRIGRFRPNSDDDGCDPISTRL
jgi:hypothetical protein